ncbi:hypothetical protein M407DRAFT_21352 [Tulasnella calospora MUT 4182]|uniref:Uncharacterized protein n=1 Tax=Tulasnella calospora MUT 4182 TaxID=1051891 RepID=A0A0C3QPV6_9AGAM|nr:hypothetical protein M407DRAFT_21352 [Tulasnella calospora MUT 4182]
MAQDLQERSPPSEDYYSPERTFAICHLVSLFPEPRGTRFNVAGVPTVAILAAVTYDEDADWSEALPCSCKSRRLNNDLIRRILKLQIPEKLGDEVLAPLRKAVPNVKEAIPIKSIQESRILGLGDGPICHFLYP